MILIISLDCRHSCELAPTGERSYKDRDESLTVFGEKRGMSEESKSEEDGNIKRQYTDSILLTSNSNGSFYKNFSEINTFLTYFLYNITNHLFNYL